MSSTGTDQPLDLSATAIAADDPRFQAMLADLQGDILQSNGRDNAAYVVLKFTGPRADVRGWIASLANTYVTSARKQLDDAAKRRADKNADGGLFGTLALSAPAYQRIGFAIDDVPRDRQAHYIAGMSDPGIRASLNDPPPQCLEPWSRDEIDAVLGLFDDQLPRLNAAVASVTAGAAGKATVLSVERGLRWTGPTGLSIEPFGYADGISQPIFVKKDAPPNPPPGAYDPTAPLSLVLIRDPNGASSQSCGSFMVYRKLKQDVNGWNAAVVQLAGRLGTAPELAGAYAVGRFKDGTPVVSSATPTGQKPDNTFQFGVDPQGTRCPFQAHIRKANPRGDTVRSNAAPLEVERSHRIARRGYVFGAQGGDHRDVGLQFVCYQSDIGNQFEFIQSAWSNTATFAQMSTGLDAVIGQNPVADGTCSQQPPESGQLWPKAWGGPFGETTQSAFSGFVSLQGGAYLFAPSISFLKGLS